METYPLGEYIPYSELHYNNALEILKNLDCNNFDDNDYNSPTVENEFFDKEYQGQFVKQPSYKNCVFNGPSFDGINGISSKIINCHFENARFKDAGMAYSNLTSTKFGNGTSFYNCGFRKCNFYGVSFRGFKAEASVFDESYFINNNINSSDFIHCSFDNAIFKNTSFKNCDLVHCNFEFTSFANVKFDNVTLPFWGVLKSFNLLQEISAQKQKNIKIKYSSTSKELSIQQLIDYLEPLQPYFLKKEEYFILANINIFLGYQDKALYALLKGIDSALKNADFRIVRYLCKLASSNILFSKTDLRELYNAIITNSCVTEMNDHEYMVYSEQIGEIKKLLIDNPYYSPQISITIKTSISPNDYVSQGNLVKFIEKSINSMLPDCYYYYNVRHNSPPIYEFFLNGSLITLYNFVLGVSIICFGISKSVKAFKDILEAKRMYLDDKYQECIADEQIRGLKLENQKKEEEIRRLKIENDRKEKNYNFHTIPFTNTDVTHQVDSIRINTYTTETEKSIIREFTLKRNADGQDNK